MPASHDVLLLKERQMHFVSSDAISQQPALPIAHACVARET
jgi:hypothetical protein